MLGFLIPLVLKLGIPAKFAKPLIYGVLAILAVAAFFGAKAIYDHGVITKHDAKVEAATAKADLKANDHASEQRRADDSRITQEADQLKKVQTNAKTDHDRSLARFRCIRLQQSARAANREPPRCDGLNVPAGANGAH